MQKPASLTSAPRTNEPALTRPGQVPSGARSPARLCFFSLSSPSDDPATLAAAWRRLGERGVGLALGLDPLERARLGWSGLEGLVRRAGDCVLPCGLVCGVSSEPLSGASSILDQLDAVARQAAAIEEAGGIPLVLPLSALARRRAREEEYVEVYRTLLARLGGPLLVDWTGPARRAELQGYFPGASFERVLALDPAKVRGARLDLDDVARETRLRRELTARDQLVLTADRQHLGRLLLGLNPGPAAARLPAVARYTELAGQRVALGDFSHALLAGSMSEAETLAEALGRLESGDAAAVLALLE
jgi:hypothetical protein